MQSSAFVTISHVDSRELTVTWFNFMSFNRSKLISLTISIKHENCTNRTITHQSERETLLTQFSKAKISSILAFEAWNSPKFTVYFALYRSRTISFDSIFNNIISAVKKIFNYGIVIIEKKNHFSSKREI